MIYFLVAQLVFDVWLLFKLGVLYLPKKKTIAQLARPINPNTAQRPCQFCGKLPSKISKDGYYACERCMDNVLHQEY